MIKKIAVLLIITTIFSINRTLLGMTEAEHVTLELTLNLDQLTIEHIQQSCLYRTWHMTPKEYNQKLKNLLALKPLLSFQEYNLLLKKTFPIGSNAVSAKAPLSYQ